MTIKNFVIALLFAAGAYLWLNLDEPPRPDREVYLITGLVFVSFMLWNLVLGD